MLVEPVRGKRHRLFECTAKSLDGFVAANHLLRRMPFDATFLVGYIRLGVWATRRTPKAMESLSDEEFARDLKGPFGGIRGSLAHMYGCDLFFYASLSGEEPIPPKGPTGEVRRNFAKTTTTRAELDRDYRSLLDRWEGLARRPEDPAAASAFVAELFALHGAKIPKWQGLPLDTDIIRFHFESAGLPWPY